MRKLSWTAAFLGVLALAGAARASVALALSVEDLTSKADAVVRGHVTGQQAQWTRSGRIVTTVHVAVDATLKGAAPAAIDVRHTGGHVGDIGQQVIGEVGFTDGEEVVLFLRRHPADAKTFTVIGLSQGKFHVERSQAEVRAVQKLDGLGLRNPVDGHIEDKPGESLPLRELEQRIAKAAGR